MGYVLFKELKSGGDVYVRSELVGIVRPMLKMGPGSRTSPMTGQRDQEKEGEYTELGLARGAVVFVDCVASEALEKLAAADPAPWNAADRGDTQRAPAPRTEKKPDDSARQHGGSRP
jgi:hypothetical protein